MRKNTHKNWSIKEQFYWFKQSSFCGCGCCCVSHKCNYNLWNKTLTCMYVCVLCTQCAKISFWRIDTICFWTVSILPFALFCFILLFLFRTLGTYVDINTFVIYISFYVTDKQTNKRINCILCRWILCVCDSKLFI